MPKKKHPEHVNLERWLVSYADFITLLFAFFVVMYALAMSDKSKAVAVAEAVRASFSMAGSIDYVDQQGFSSGKTLQKFDRDQPTGGVMVTAPMGKVNIMAREYEDLKHMADILEESVSYELGASATAEKIQIDYDKRGLVVRLSAKDFFLQGDAAVRTDALPMLNQIAKILKNTKHHIRIEGHTDDQAVQSENYPTNWELSGARATWVIRYLTKKFEFDPKRMSAMAYGQYKPVTDNATEAGRAKNRRIEIVVLAQDPI